MDTETTETQTVNQISTSDNVFTDLAMSGNPTIAILSTIVIVEFAVIVYLGKYIKDQTVPLKFFDEAVTKITRMADQITAIALDQNKYFELLKTLFIGNNK